MPEPINVVVARAVCPSLLFSKRRPVANTAKNKAPCFLANANSHSHNRPVLSRVQVARGVYPPPGNYLPLRRFQTAPFRNIAAPPAPAPTTPEKAGRVFTHTHEPRNPQRAVEQPRPASARAEVPGNANLQIGPPRVRSPPHQPKTQTIPRRSLLRSGSFLCDSPSNSYP
jgi:hypothetical protein